MTTTARLLNPIERSHLRPFDVSRDLNPVADLIERCFEDTLDADGQRYLRQMRSAARNPRFLRWAASVSEHVLLPLTGYVWEEAGSVVGNLSLIPMNAVGKRIYLIANVAVDPEYRRRGIARSLTRAALDLASRRQQISAIWLQVRAENGPALHLYQSLEFVERARRTSWQWRQDYWPKISVPQVRIRGRGAHLWARQRAWLQVSYPEELSWNLTLNLNVLRPGLWGLMARLLIGTRVRQWAALRDDELLGVLSRQAGALPGDQLWLAAPPESEELAIRAFFGHLQHEFPAKRLMTLDYPAERGVQALESVGFTPQQTLIWMALDLHQ